MNSAQHAVLWLGLGLIAVNLLTGKSWSTLWGTLKSGTASSSGSSGSTSGSGSGSSGSAPKKSVIGNVPSVGFLPV